MSSARKRADLLRRRRLDDEADDVSVATGLHDDSQSDISARSDADDNADADNSDLSGAESTRSLTEGKTKRKAANGARSTKAASDVTNQRVPSPPIARSDSKFNNLKDTEAMLNGLKISGPADGDEAVDFETGSISGGPVIVSSQPAGNRGESIAERRRREHEEYKQKRDSDPSFTPNRGAFFMHDQRSAHGQNGFKPAFPRGGAAGAGRGRGGARVGGPFSPANLAVQAAEPTDSPWKHDLHQAIIDSPPPQPQQRAPLPQGVPPTSAPTNPALNPPQQPGRPRVIAGPGATQTRNFSTTVHTANAMIRVFLPGMKAPVTFQNVPIKQHTRLPNHRPPLRRDKPVRISLPNHPPRYIFPTIERSFIFIPRALRPNQQGFGRGRGRLGSFGGGFSSRRTSAYGGSVYSPSIAMSRRSSMAREMGRDGLVSPAGSVMSRPGGVMDRPTVRLPPGGPRMISPQSGAPGGFGQYPLPQKPTFRENFQHLEMHQPRPQKTVSVAGIESPASMNFNPPQQQEQQPFHQQVPAHINGAEGAPPEQPLQPQQVPYPHARQPSFPSQASTGTPLSNIPERAVHAAAFQPYQQPGFQPQPYGMPPTGYYYPPNGAPPQYAPAGGMVSMYVPNAQQPGYVMPMPAPPASTAPASAGQVVPYEFNGMMYYTDPSTLQVPPPMEGYPPQAPYAVPGMGGMMTPSPEGAYYYPQQMQPAPGVFYPQQ